MGTSYRQLLVHLDSSDRSAVRLAIARRLAEEQGASLAALYAVTPTLVALPPVPALSPEMAANMAGIDDDRRRRARAVFDRTMATAGARTTWSEAREPPVIAAFSQQALYADLLVLGQHEPAGQQALDLPPDFCESVMAASGKPALVVPYANMPNAVGDTVVIAWKETREAARAVTAALPLLRRARVVHVLSWAESEPVIEGPALDLGTYLELHQVEPVWHHQGKEPDFLGEILLSTTFDLDADLLVMGCYGHSRAREWVLGGTSRTVLRSMTCPVLMVH